MTVVPPGGKHLILELWSDRADLLCDHDKIRDICIAAAKKANATVITEHFHHFGEEYGVSGVVVLAESHISIHTWPEEGYCAIDVFMCGACDPNDTLEIFETELESTKCSIKVLYRPI